MDAHLTLTSAETSIIDEAFATLRAAHASHYDAQGEAATRQRLRALFWLATAAMRDRQLCPMIRHSDRVARERFRAGFCIEELQAAYNALEVAMWRHLVAELPQVELVEPIGVLSTVMGAGKDALARAYVSMASRRHVPALDLSALFSGATA